MKKNISINISGIIFHIEEDGYENLRKYLDSINKYFSSFEDSSEILADIESRIAEIFLSKLNEGKQVITAEDVNALIATMGSVSDFKAAEEQEFTQPGTDREKSEETQTQDSSQKSYKYTGKQLQRDQKRKILGGVCAGLGNYFNIDAVWVRLFFALLLAAYGVTFFVYIILWIVLPGSYDMEEPEVEKKMYRDPERKVLAGVSGGLAAYFGIDIIAVRILFVIFTFIGGLGLLIYLVLWIALPEARSLTDKMQMQGEPVTLSNIESNIKKNLNVNEGEEESAIVKILLFPFRLIAFLINALAKIVGPLMEVLRVAIGLFVFFLGMGFILSVIVCTGIIFGLFSGAGFPMFWGVEFNELSLPLDAFRNSFPTWTTIAAFFGAIIPCIFLMLLGISIIAKRIVFSAAIGWSMFVIFFLSVAVLSVGIPRIVYSFKEEGEYKVEHTYQLNGKTAVLKLRETGLDDYEGASLVIRGYHGADFKLEQTFEAQGGTRLKATEYAQMVDYHVDFQDSIFTFDSNISFKEDAIFRAQRLEMLLYVPYNQPFLIGDGMYRLISQYLGDWSLREGNTWIVTEDGLKCTTCPPEPEEENEEEEESSSLGVHDQYGLSGFEEVNVSGFIDLKIYRGDEFSVEIIGPDSEKDKYNIYQNGNILFIKYEDEKKFTWKRGFGDFDEVRINITMPHLKRLELKGVGDVMFRNFTEEESEIEVLGVIKAKGEDFNCRNFYVRLNGASELDLYGRGTNLDASVQGASKLHAYDYEVANANVEANGASGADVFVTGTLEMEEGVASDIDYKGSPRVIRRD